MELKASELRIGNLVDYLCEDKLDDRQEWYEPTVIDWQDIKYLSEKEVRNKGLVPDGPVREHYKPIPITEDWLLKLGFVRSNNPDLLFFSIPMLHIEIHAEKYRGRYVIQLANHIKPIVTEIEFVHQLQNLIYALSGTELTLTDKTN